MKQTYDWESAYPAPAKLNLFLHVTGRRANGYHELQTVFCLIDYADVLRFSPRSDGKIELATPLPDVPAEANLVVRAARLLQEETHCSHGVTISLEKNLPLGGGLGGGSSDAATTLLALNHLWQVNLSRQRLQEIGLKLGADVPVFIFGQNAFAEGVGETLQAIDLPPTYYLLVEPPVQVPTALIFSAPELCRNSAKITQEKWHPDFGINDLEAVARAHFPIIGEYLDYLARFGKPKMSGSGACIFIALPQFSTAKDAEKILTKLPATMQARLVKSLSQHPLHGLA